jgi:hypothetical protein
MSKPIGVVVACALALWACNVEHYDECSRDDAFEETDDWPTRPSGGGKPAGGAGSGAQVDGSEDGGASGDDGATPVEPPSVPCENERDCAPGFNCNYEQSACEPAAAETCTELDLEVDCTARADCIPVYGGTNCSCGRDCECEGGEPGCICESFEFFVCRAAAE